MDGLVRLKIIKEGTVFSFLNEDCIHQVRNAQYENQNKSVIE